MNASESIQSCAMCAGLFPGPGIVEHGKVYCCDKCANMQQHKLRGLLAMAPKLIGVLSVGAIFGYLIRGK